MIFEHPHQFFWFFLFLFLLIILWRAGKIRKSLLAALIQLSVIEKIFPFKRWQQLNFKKNLLQMSGFFFLILSLTGPQIGQKLREIKVKGINVFILIDTSDSMLAEDFKPNRMEKSKRTLSAILEKLSSQKVGIIAFAGEPYVYCPLTFDAAAVKQFLKSIEPGMVPQPGTRIGSAIRLALSKFPEGQSSNAIILLTDGEDHRSDPIGAAEQARKMGVKIFAVGIGNPEGEPIPIRDSSGKTLGYKKRKNGEVILSRLDESDLAQMALLTGGSYFRASESEQEIDLLLEKLSQMEKEISFRTENIYEERYQWTLLMALIFLIASEIVSLKSALSARPGKIRLQPVRLKQTVALLIVFLGTFGAVPSQKTRLIYAASFREKMQEGNKFYKDEKYSEALESFEQASQKNLKDLRANFNKGDALYRTQEWDQASEEFQKSAGSNDSELSAKAYFNLGNSQFQKGAYADAVRSYQQSLKLNPADGDAKFNLDLALQIQRNPPPRTQHRKSGEKQKNQKNGKKESQSADENQKKEREENAKRTLKGAVDSQNDKPLFKPETNGKKRDDEEDW